MNVFIASFKLRILHDFPQIIYHLCLENTLTNNDDFLRSQAFTFESIAGIAYSSYNNPQQYLFRLRSVDSAISRPVLFGRTDQYEPVIRIIESTEGITTARGLLESIIISCRKDLECTELN